MKRILTGVLLLLSAGCLHAQQVDSTYHNYLYDSRVAYFRQLPAVNKAVVFWGDSITHWGDWAELLGFGKVLNRGIAGDNTYGLKARMDEVLRHQPRKLFILIGTNDINKKIPSGYIVANYRRMIRELKAQSPATEVYVQSVFPVNDQLIGRQYYTGTNAQILALNKALQQMAAAEQVTYVDVHSHLLDADRQLDARYTYDGLHLSGMGYLAWVQYLRQQRLL
ncbi:GDSL-type esterase/lipase family protein [Chitinophaga japonensis]|uniref:Lysophospholipase L1-like esterase n=1 Tax=Chitinophaga japonensis TaxID=104662 RepID=A0A562TIA8_CHIJA|nr:GDSL-type esterase/lipase family protein [Chitinophaga japonensis]TWI92390.1 lysophospholipase L1-like esterase [Chitinophaga japonensis]